MGDVATTSPAVHVHMYWDRNIVTVDDYTCTLTLDTYTVPVYTCTMDHGLLEVRRQPNLHPTDLAYTTQIIRTLHELVESSTPYICTGQSTASPTHQEAIHMKHGLWVQDTFLQCLESPLQFLHDYGKGEGGREGGMEGDGVHSRTIADASFLLSRSAHS